MKTLTNKLKVLTSVGALLIGLGSALPMALAEEHHDHDMHRDFHHGEVHEWHHEWHHHDHVVVVPNGFRVWPGPYERPDYEYVCDAWGHHCYWIPLY